MMVAIQSCKKDEVIASNVEDNTSIKMVQNGEEDLTETKILRFFERMSLVKENPNCQGSDNWNYSNDSTVWYIEAALNYKYAYKWQYEGNEEHTDLYGVDSSFTTILSNSSEIYNIVEIQKSYDELASKLELQYNNAEADSKFFVFSDILDKGKSGNALSIMQYSVIGKANQVMPQSGWIWGNGLGDCAGNNFGMDATNIIENRLLAYRYGITSPTGYYGFVNIANNITISPTDVPIPSGVNNPTSFEDYYLFSFYNDNGNPCLSYSDINWYASNIVNIEQDNKPTGNEIVFTEVQSDFTVYGSSSAVRHIIEPYYGEVHFYAYTTPID